ncbi:MAG: hypothetical protein ABSC04_19960 [Syntrophobacteraceae bacterium]|jgi:hypothetical protein
MGDVIGGTVIQRSFIGIEATNIIHAASVPLVELGLADEDPEEIFAEVLGIPSTAILDTETYNRVIAALRNYPPEYFFPFLHPRTQHHVDRLYLALQSQGSPKEFLSDFLALVSGASSLYTMGNSWPFFLEPEYHDFNELRPEVLNTAIQCIRTRLFPSWESEQFTNEIFSYGMPLGQSPEVKSDSLHKLLDTSKKFCVAPLVLGGGQAISQLTQGNYVAALLTTGTASLMTLIFIGTVSVGALLVQRVAQARSKSRRKIYEGGPSASAGRATRSA